MPYPYLEHVRPEFQEIAVQNRTIELHEYEEMRMNSYERAFLLPYFSDEVLLQMIEYARRNSSTRSYPVPVTYNDAIIDAYMPELMKRFRVLKEQHASTV